MEQVAISKFKAQCLGLVEKVRATGRPLLVTKRGVPVAQVLPPPLASKKRILGVMEGTVRFMGDVVSPAVDPEEWEVLRD